jgi:hypothetical protein
MPISTLSGTAVAASALIDRAMRLIQQISPGVSPTTDEYAAGLTALNGLLDAWRNESLMCYTTQDESLTLVAAQTSYTIGSAGNLNTNRPIRIDRAYVTYQTVSYPVDIYTNAQYEAIPVKSQAGTFPTVLYYSPDMDLGNLYPWPICNTTGVVLHLITWTPLVSFATTATTTTFAPGWQDAVTFALAIALAPEYEYPVPPDLREMAKNAKKGIQTINSRTPVSTFDGTLMRPSRYNIIGGYY